MPCDEQRELLHPGAHHSQMFDARSLTTMLQEAGFAAPQTSSFGASEIPDVLEVELEERRNESLYMEAQKVNAPPSRNLKIYHHAQTH